MIERIEINGFRLLDGFAADFTDLNVIIGANASGKSTVLNVLQFVAELMNSPLEDAFRTHGGFFSVPSAFRRTDEISLLVRFHRPRIWSKLTAIPVPIDKAFTYEVRLQISQDGTVRVAKEVLAFAQPDRGMKQPLKLIDASLHRSFLYDFKQKQLVSFDSVVQPDQASALSTLAATTTTVATAQLGKASEAKPKLRLAQMQFFNEYPLQSYIRSMLALMNFFPGFNVGRYSAVRTEASEIRPSTTLAQDGKDLGTVLHEIFNIYEFRPAADELREFVRAAYPEIQDITAETTWGAPPKVLLKTRETGMNRSMEVWDLSDGTLRFLCLAAALLNPRPPSLIGLDEPEIGLHPRLLPIVADMIKSAASRTQVLVTTHSPDLLGRFDLSNVVVMRRDGPKAAWTRPGNAESLRQLLEPLGATSIGDLHRSGELEAEA